MRISDWSSDVCSSDLADAEIAFSGRDAGEVVALLLLAAEFQHHRTALAVGDPVRADGNGCSQQFLGHDIAFERGTGLTAIFLRSEEHTSELQSLMRISYAVFCWKKKKQTIPQTHSMNH